MKKLLFKLGDFIVPNRYKTNASMLYQKMRSLILRGTTDTFNDVSIETSTKCNRRCSYCPNSKYPRGQHQKYMPEKLFYKIINDLQKIKYDGRVLLAFYNEPLLDKRMEKFASHIKKKLPNCTILMHTNGDYLDRARFDSLVKSGVDVFGITRHGKIMNPKLKLFLENLRPEDKKHVVLQKLTENSELTNRGGEVKIKHKRPIAANCLLPSQLLQIDYQGNIVLCCMDYHSSIKLGDVKKESILQIWNKKQFKDLRRNLRHGHFNLQICKKCRA